MASASFTLRAVDSTKAAFASVQNSLKKLEQSSQTAAGFMKKAFDPRALGAGFAAALGLSLTSILDSAINKLMEFATRAKNITEALRASSLEVSEIYAQDAFEQLSLGQKIQSLEAKRLENAKEIKRLAEATKSIENEPSGTETMGEFQALTGSGRIGSTRAGTLEEANKLAKLEKQYALDSVALNKLKADAEKIESDRRIAAIQGAGAANRNAIDESIALRKRDFEDAEIAFENLMEQRATSRKDSEDKINQDRAASESLQNLASAQLDILDPLRKYKREIELVNNLTLEGLLTESESISRKQQINAEMEQYGKIIEDIIPAQVEMNTIANDAGAMIAQGFEDAILSGQKLGEVVRSLGRDLLRLVFNQMVTQPLASGISGFIRAALTPRAMGGPVSSGSPYLVGEEGPELFVPHASGTIVPNNKMGSGSGGGAGGVTINYNIASGVSRAELVPILDQERRRLKAEIPDMVRRGGAYRAAFA